MGPDTLQEFLRSVETDKVLSEGNAEALQLIALIRIALALERIGEGIDNISRSATQPE